MRLTGPAVLAAKFASPLYAALTVYTPAVGASTLQVYVVLVPLEVGVGVDVQLEALPLTEKTMDPVGAGRLATPVTRAVKVNPLPTTGELGDAIRLIPGSTVPRLTEIVEEVAVL